MGQFLQHSTHTQFRWKTRGPATAPPAAASLTPCSPGLVAPNQRMLAPFKNTTYRCLKDARSKQSEELGLAGRGDPGLATREGGREGEREASWVATTRQILGHAHSRTGSVTNSSSQLRKADVECVLLPQPISPISPSTRLAVRCTKICQSTGQNGGK